MKRYEKAVVCAGLWLALGLAADSPAAEPRQRGPQVLKPFHWDVSAPLKDIRPLQRGRELFLDRAEIRRPRPFHLSRITEALDGALQTRLAPAALITQGIDFDGIGEPNLSVNVAPPDTNGSVGRTINGVGYYIQWVNLSFGVFNKATGQLVFGPADGNTLWSGFGGQCEATNDGDPIVTFDKLANRWVFMQFAVESQPFLQCVAVSQTSNPLGAYNRYAFSYGNLFNDYPKVGVWPDAYYVSYNMFTNGQTFAGGEVCALDRTAMLAGAAASQQCFLLSNFGGLLPSDFDGTILPAAGAPNVVLNFGSNVLDLWKFHVDFANPANTTLSGPTVLPVAAFNEACGTGGSCVTQPGTKNKLDSLGDRLMYRLAYRRFADGHEALVVNHSVANGRNARRSPTAVRWYELRGLAGTPSVFQQGTFTNGDSNFRWMGSAAMDKAGNIAVGYSVSSDTLRPSIRFTGRGPADPAGTLGAEVNLLTGVGSQTGALHRWGDYSSLSVDPDDDCTFWYTNEYLKASGSFNWSTHVGSFKLNNCQ